MNYIVLTIVSGIVFLFLIVQAIRHYMLFRKVAARWALQKKEVDPKSYVHMGYCEGVAERDRLVGIQTTIHFHWNTMVDYARLAGLVFIITFYMFVMAVTHPSTSIAIPNISMADLIISVLGFLTISTMASTVFLLANGRGHLAEITGVSFLIAYVAALIAIAALA